MKYYTLFLSIILTFVFRAETNILTLDKKGKITVALFDIENLGIPYEEYERIYNIIASGLDKPGKVEVLNKNQMNTLLLNNDFLLVVKDEVPAMAAGKLPQVDKAILGIIGWFEDSWRISVKVIDI